MAEAAFLDWLSKEIDKGFRNPTDFAVKAGIDTGFMSKVFSGERNPGITFYERTAKALGYKLDYILQMAGVLPLEPDQDPTEEELLALYNQLTDKEKKEVRDWIRFKKTNR